MKAVRILFKLAVLLVTASACADELDVERALPAGTAAVLKLDVRALEDYAVDTRSRFGDEVETICSGITLACYRLESALSEPYWHLIQQDRFSSIEDACSGEIQLLRGYSYRVCAVMNLGAYSFPERYDELVNRVYKMGEGNNCSYAGVLENGIPASGQSEDFLLDSESRTVRIVLDRLFAKIVFSVDHSGYTPQGTYADPGNYFREYDISVSHLNANLVPFRTGDFHPPFEDADDEDYQICSQIGINNSYSFYVPENIPPETESRVALSDVSDEALPTMSSTKTKLTFSAEFLERSGYQGLASYTCYPGPGLETYKIGSRYYRHFDLRRNKVYNLSLCFAAESVGLRSYGLRASWQLDVSQLYDCRAFGIAMTPKDDPHSEPVVREWSNFDCFNMMGGENYVCVAARQDDPAVLRMWYSDGGDESDLTVNKFSKETLHLGSRDEKAKDIRDNRFVINLEGPDDGGIYCSDGQIVNELEEYFTVAYDADSGVLTFVPTLLGVGAEFLATMTLMPGALQLSFRLRLLPGQQLDAGLDDYYVAMKRRLRMCGISGDFTVSADKRCLKTVPSAGDSDFIGSGSSFSNEALEYGIDLYAFEGCECLNLEFIPLDVYNDRTMRCSFPVFVPGVSFDRSDCLLPIDGSDRPSGLSYHRRDGSRIPKSDFDPDAYAQTLRPDAFSIEDLSGGSGPADCILLDRDEEELCLGTIPPDSLFPSGVMEHGSSLAASLNIAAPEHYYGPGVSSARHLMVSVPQIGDFAVKRVISDFYDRPFGDVTTSNNLDLLDLNSNEMGVTCFSEGSRGDRAEFDMDEKKWSYTTDNRTLADINKVPYGITGTTFTVRNRNDGSIWERSRSFELSYDATVNIYAYFGVTSDRHNVQNVWLGTARHWAYLTGEGAYFDTKGRSAVEPTLTMMICETNYLLAMGGLVKWASNNGEQGAYSFKDSYLVPFPNGGESKYAVQYVGGYDDVYSAFGRTILYPGEYWTLSKVSSLAAGGGFVRYLNFRNPYYPSQIIPYERYCQLIKNQWLNVSIGLTGYYVWIERFANQSSYADWTEYSYTRTN